MAPNCNTGGLIAETAEARSLVGQLRAHLAQSPDDPRGGELLELMQANDSRFAELWHEHGVAGFTSSRKQLSQAELGRLNLDYTKLDVAGDEQQSLIVFFPCDDNTAEVLAKFRP